MEVAQKELKIEQKLRVITANWAEMTLDYVPHKGTDMMVIRPSEEVIEGLDADSLELQTIFAMGKPMEFFKTEVLMWQATLGTIRYHTIPYDTMRYDTMRYDTMRYDAIRYDAIRIRTTARTPHEMRRSAT